LSAPRIAEKTPDGGAPRELIREVLKLEEQITDRLVKLLREIDA